MKSHTIDYLQRIVFLLPVAFLIGVFVAYPFMSSIYYSFTDWDGLSQAKFIGLDNYKYLFHDLSFLHSLKNIAFFTLGAVFLLNPLSLALGMALNSSIRGKSLLRTVFYLPSIISLIVISNIWVIILAYDGILNKVMEEIGLGTLTLDWLGDYDRTPWVILFIILWQGLGNSAVFYIAGLQSIPTEIYEAADIDGATPLSRFWNITVPLLMPTVTIVTFFQLSGMLKLFDLPLIMTKGGPGDVTLTPTMLIYNQVYQASTAGYATTTGVVVMIIIVAVSAVQLKLTRSREVEL
ncbi:carbohydrate ABC transporter permease [Cohnella soli]|uniref:Carbohydrate ABC transporter permease n=1 Tax=Cohnella soli TaxID=425005 RepID=A0ABW0HPR5_9BACL